MARVVSVNISEKKGTLKKPVPEIELKLRHGIVGDAHAGDWHRQISLLAEESIDTMRALSPIPLDPGVFAENINTEGIDLKHLPVGTHLRIGETEVEMTQIGKELRATSITMSNLSSLVDFIKKSKADFKTGHYIAQVVSPTEVRLFSSLDADRQRETLAVVKAEIPEFSFGQFIGNEEFVIGVQSKFLNEDAEANDKPIILQFAGNVKAGTVAEYGDTGVGQKAAIKKGVASLQEVEVPSPCRLTPYRTFTEVAQPMSNFIFRVKDNDRYGVTCALFEADGGAWKNEAKANIKAYLEKELADVSNIFVIS